MYCNLNLYGYISIHYKFVPLNILNFIPLPSDPPVATVLLSFF